MVLGISNQSESIIRQFIEDQGITFPILRDISGVYLSYNIPGGSSPYPRDYIVDTGGIIRFADTEYDPGTMIATIESLAGEVSTGGQVEKPSVAAAFSIASIYPNPFNPVTTIEFISQRNALVTLAVTDLAGRKMETIFHQDVGPGRHEVQWNARNVPSGIYFVRMDARDSSDGTAGARRFTETRKAVLLK